MSSVSDDNKTIAKTLAGAFGGKPSIRKYWDDDKRSSVDLMTCVDAPQVGVNSYATVNLSDYPLLQGGQEYPVRAEIVGACSAQYDKFSSVVATCAFCIINDKWFASPGAIFPNIVSMYDISKTMKHIAFVPPFLWEDQLPTLTFAAKKVDWLLALPISDGEYKFALDNSFDALEEHFEREQIDIFELNRRSTK